MDEAEQTQAADPFARFWGELMSRMGTAGFPGSAPAQTDGAAKHMQRIFLDAWAKYCDDFLRSPEFLETMKQTMDNALAFRKQVDQFLSQAHHNLHAPSAEDVHDMVALVRAVEERLLARLEELEAKIGRGSGARKKSPTAASARKRTAGTTRTRKPARWKKASPKRQPATKPRAKTAQRKKAKSRN